MDRIILRDLAAFEAIARHRSFVGAAAELGLSPSALSHALTLLEQRLGVTLLARTTRSVAPTEAGQRLLQTLAPALQDIAAELRTLQDMRETISGTVRLTTIRAAHDTLLRPMLPAFLAAYPDVVVDISIEDGLSDLVPDGYDGGIRFGTLVSADMVALPLTRTSAAVIVGAPSYFHAAPIPRAVADLAAHRCIVYRHGASGQRIRWQLEQDGRRHDVKVQGQLVVDDAEALRQAALDGLGLAWLFASQVQDDIAAGRLVSVMQPCVPDLPGFSLHYPDRRRTSPAFRAMIEHLRKPR